MTAPKYIPKDSEIPKDKELRSRVKLLGTLLGNVLRAHAGEKVYAAVESLRRGFVGLRKQEDEEKRHHLRRLIEHLDPSTLTQVVRAFSIYFGLVNLAEEAFQHRNRRRQFRAGLSDWTGSFDETLHWLRNQGVTADQLQSLLAELRYIPVLTAHPTEAKRRTIMEAMRRIFVTSNDLDDRRLSKDEQQEVIDSLQNQIQILWKTDEVRTRRPQVRDEIRMGLFYFRESLFEAVPETYRHLETAIHKIYGPMNDGRSVEVPSFLSFGSWVGGDRDGNPNVKPDTTRLALRFQHREVLSEYLRKVQHLTRVLTQSDRMIEPTRAFLESLEQDAAAAAEAFREAPQRFEHEPYRRKLYIMRYRLQRNIEIAERRLHDEPIDSVQHAYSTERELLKDLYLIRDSLYSHGDGNIADADLKDLIRLVESFGFHMLALDVREESTQHTLAVAEIIKQLRGIDYQALSESERHALLVEILSDPGTVRVDRDALPERQREVLAVFDMMTDMRHELGDQSFGSYVISMTHAASHVLEVMLMGRLAGLIGRSGDQWYCHIRPVPLFETIDDLEHVQQVLTALFDEPVYQTLLNASGNTQEIMLGYSDSTKDGGIVSSAWNLYQAQKTVIAMTTERGIGCRLFHGRGGTIGRGGGPMHQSILARPPGTVRGQIKFTEQGEVASYKYSNRETAVYELSVGITGLIKASHCLLQTPTPDNPDHLAVFAELADIGEDAYRELTDKTPGFIDYFYEANPVEELGLLNIGSRPTHRVRADRSKESIRAIPWVFGWAQSRHTLPAWYGLGTALSRWRGDDPQRLAQLRAMYRDWPFFRTLISNTQMALVKADMNVAGEYSQLSLDPAIRDRVYGMVRAEYEGVVNEVLTIGELDGLLQETPALALSLARRNPYLDPLNEIQIALLKRYRDESLPEEERTRWLDPLLRSINAIAAGMRNTG